MNFSVLCFMILLHLSSQLRNLQYSSFFPSNMSPQSKNQIESDDCQIFCLQPDSRLCQCSKEELNKYKDLLFQSTNSIDVEGFVKEEDVLDYAKSIMFERKGRKI